VFASFLLLFNVSTCLPPFWASPPRCELANASGRIEFNIVLFMDWSFASGCPPPRLMTGFVNGEALRRASST
jgi:hypothetical protein